MCNHFTNQWQCRTIFARQYMTVVNGSEQLKLIEEIELKCMYASLADKLGTE